MINGRGSLPRDLSTLAEVLQAEGFDTGAFIGSFVVHQKFGLQKGFSVYDDDMTMTPTTVDGLHRQRELGISPAAEIRRIRLERARELLAVTNLSIPEVAAASG